MSDRLDRTLEALDVGLQSSSEHGYPAGTDLWRAAPPDDTGLCARCQHHGHGDGDLCAGCRDFLLGDTDLDPARQPWALDDLSTWVGQIPERLAQDGAPVVHEWRYRVGDGDWQVVAPNALGLEVSIPGGVPVVVASFAATGTSANELAAFQTSMADLAACLAPTPEDLDRLAAGMRALAESFAGAVVDAVASLGEWLAGVAEQEWFKDLLEAAENRAAPAPAARTARDRELELLDELRRSHRRTNRWGPPPGRR